MRRLIAMPVVCLLCLPCRSDAEEVEPLEVEFLEYLAGFGSDEENWALFADDEPAAPAVRQQEVSQQEVVKDGSPNKTQAAAKPADER